MPERLDATTLAKARRTLARRDPRLTRLMREVGPCRIEQRGDPYRALLRSVLYQQLAGSAAAAIARRFCAPYRGRYPKPADLLAAPVAKLRAAGLSRQKIAALRAVAEAFDSRALDNRRLRRMDDDAVVEAVTQVHGIGTWTAHMLLMFSLARPDVLPTGDYGVRKGAMLVYGLGDLPKPKQLEAIAEPWRPYRSVGSWYMWRALETVTPR